ncbi:MAG: signal recognition particle-docking protein FtsY [Candidatus Marinimicrobia bacterium]|nr:signal recognition particle-docking protein FtsY [Candidatus Neomarinimicrobiota bacterium]
MKTIFQKFVSGLSKTRSKFRATLSAAVSRASNLDEEVLENIESALIQTDMGIDMAAELIDKLKAGVDADISEEEIYGFLSREIRSKFSGQDWDIDVGDDLPAKPYVIMVVGVNGTGKTTTVGKLAYLHKRLGRKVLLAAADTFRAAAVEQLTVWSERAGVDLVKSDRGAEPASVAHNALTSAQSRGMDVLIVDTAGRLHTSKNLMEELKKIKRVLGKDDETSPHEILLTLDANNGQNAHRQAKEFNEMVGVTGIVLAKLDGTAKGGIVLSINNELDIPVKYIGVGEDLEDLEPFEPEAFASSLFYAGEYD